MARFLSFWDEVPASSEEVRGSSMTIPDQSLSVRDILNRYQLGSVSLDFPSAEEIDDSDFIDTMPNDMDLVEASDLVRNGNDIIGQYSAVSHKDVSSGIDPPSSSGD